MMINLRRSCGKNLLMVLLTVSFIFMSSYSYADEIIELEFGNEALEEYMTYQLEEGFHYECKDTTIISVSDNVLSAVKYGDTAVTVKDEDGNVIKTIEVIVYFVGDELTPWSAATVNKPYLSGYPDKSFKPKNFMTRAEVAAVFTNLLDLSHKSDISYLDMNKTHWGYDAVASVTEHQLMLPRLVDEFYPDAYITREEMAAVISKFAERKYITLDNSVKFEISDVTNKDAYFSQVHEMLNINLMHLTETMFYPNEFMKREDVIKLVNEITCLKLETNVSDYFSDVNDENENQLNINNAVLFTP